MTSAAVFAARGARLVVSGCLVAVAALGTAAGASAAGPSDEPVAAPARPYATVTTSLGLNERQYPSTDSSVRGVLRYRAQVGVACKVRAQNIEGNTLWYLVRDNRRVWIAGRFVHITGTVHYCKDIYRSSARSLSHADG